MSCEIAFGRKEECKDSISGLQAIYIINYGIAPADITYSATNADEITDITGVTTVYKYELKGTNAFEQTINSSRENGTTFFEQSLTIQLKRQDPITHLTFKKLAYGRPHIIVHTRNNQFFLAGAFEGCDVTTGTVSSGTAYGDFNGYGLTFIANEKLPANFIDATDEPDLLTTVLNGAVIGPYVNP
jgi:hypothetical protein